MRIAHVHVGCSMIQVPATAFSRHFGRYTRAVRRESVEVTSRGRTCGYFLSAAEFEEYRRLKARATRVFHVSELPPETIDAIAAARMDPMHDHLDRLLDENVAP
jgi:prevent-host-death family protein